MIEDEPENFARVVPHPLMRGVWVVEVWHPYESWHDRLHFIDRGAAEHEAARLNQEYEDATVAPRQREGDT